jgi:uncharacterized delta-60 repeat protein
MKLHEMTNAKNKDVRSRERKQRMNTTISVRSRRYYRYQFQACARFAKLPFVAMFASVTWLTSTLVAQTFPWDPLGIGRLIPQPDGKVLIGGSFEAIDGVVSRNLARLNADGALDSSFVPSETLAEDLSTINWVATQPDGRILVAGWSSNGIVRLEKDGRLDSTFQSPILDPSGGLLGVQGGGIQKDGRILIFGQFGGIGGEVRDGIARLDANGALDRSFNPRLESRGSFGKPEVLAVQEDGRILIGGHFDTVDGQPRPKGLARLNMDGSLDPNFVPGGEMTGVPLMLAVTPEGKVYVNVWGGVTRLNADGSPDSQFNPGFGISSTNGEPWISTLALQTDGRLLLGGDFHFYDGIPRAGLARVQPDGSLDAGFDGQLTLSPRVRTIDEHNVDVWAIALQSNGGMFIAGTFTGVGGISRSWLAHLDANGKPDAMFHAFRPIIRSISIKANGLVTMKIAGETGRPYRVEESNDLLNWQPLRNFLIQRNSVEFVDVRQPLLHQLFYRISSE